MRFLNKKIILQLLLVFALSVIIRLPNLDRPLSKHHDYCTAVALNVLQAWQQNTEAAKKVSPLLTYANTGDKFVCQIAGLTNKEGNQYYISHPPFAYVLPHVIFSTFNIAPTVLAIQIFHLFFNCISALLIYLIIVRLFDLRQSNKQQTTKSVHQTALLGYTLYLFNPCTLWFQGNVYMSDMFVQTFFLWAVCNVVSLLQSNNKRNPFKYSLLFISVALACYTEWLGYFFAASVVLFWLVTYKRKNTHFLLPLSVSLACMVALSLTLYSYCTITTAADYFATAQSRLQMRSGYARANFITTLIQVVKNYTTSFLPIILCIAVLLFIVRKKIFNSYPSIIFTFLLIVPIVLHHTTFFYYTGEHDFAVLKAAPFLCITAAMLLYFLQQQIVVPRPQLTIVVMAMLISMVAMYFYINKPGQYSWKKDEYAVYKRIGEYIKQHTTQDGVIFLQGVNAVPQIDVYALRNTMNANTREDALNFLKEHNHQKGYWLTIENNQVIKQQIIEVK